MSYFDEQYEAWMNNDCKGRIEDYDPYDADSWPEENDDSHLNQQKLANAKGIVRLDNPDASFSRGEDWLAEANRIATRDMLAMRKLYAEKSAAFNAFEVAK